jgi:hypothetical protein
MMPPSISSIVPVLLLLVGACAEQQPLAETFSKSPLDQAFEAKVNETLVDWKVPGLAIAVVDGSNTYSQV